MQSARQAKRRWIKTSVGVGWRCGGAGDSAAYVKV